MLISHQVQSRRRGRHGSGPASLAELRRQLTKPSELDDGLRQRLLDLARRLARVRALGNEYARVDLSEHAAAALRGDLPACDRQADLQSA